MYLKEKKNRIMLDKYTKRECSVNLVSSESITNIRRFYGDDGKFTIEHRVLNNDIGESVRIEFRDGDRVLATSDDDGYVQIGLDFIWTYLENFENIKSVYLHFNSENELKVRANGDVVVYPCDQKEYTEKDVIIMLSYAISNKKITSKEMKESVDDVLNWFKND